MVYRLIKYCKTHTYILSFQENPFVIFNKEYPIKSNEQYTGFLIDLLREIQNELNFKYDIHLVEDGQYGDIDPETGRWTGMIQEVIEWVLYLFYHLKCTYGVRI